MRSLTAHLRESEGHDRLPFHPSCPICRQTRLSGTIASGALVSQRTQALLAASILAASATAPATAALAAENDQQHDGATTVGQSGPSDSANSPDFDPGGDATDLPVAAVPVPQAQAPVDPGTDDTAPVEPPSATNPDDPVVDPGDGSDAAPPQPAPAPPSATAPTATAPGAPATTAPPTPTAAPAPAAPAPAAAAPRAARERAARRARSGRRAHTPTKPSNAASQATATASVNAAAPTAAPGALPAAAVRRSVAVASGPRARPGDRAHSVLAGESLWSIATDVLGAGATPAQVAREVHRVWQLNRDRIGTGDPDLLPVGTRLALR